MHLPIGSSFVVGKSEVPVPRWVDPCKARPFTILEPVRDFAGLSVTDEQEQEVFDAVISATRMAHTQAERVKSKFVSHLCVSNDARVRVIASERRDDDEAMRPDDDACDFPVTHLGAKADLILESLTLFMAHTPTHSSRAPFVPADNERQRFLVMM